MIGSKEETCFSDDRSFYVSIVDSFDGDDGNQWASVWLEGNRSRGKIQCIGDHASQEIPEAGGEEDGTYEEEGRCDA